MSGGKSNGVKLRETMIKKHGSEEAWKAWLAQNGARGGRNGHTSSFTADPELARRVGKIGGTRSRRGKAKNENR